METLHLYRITNSGSSNNIIVMQNIEGTSGMRIHNDRNERLYLNASERQAFIDACHRFPPLQRSFCLMLAYTGCRISEAINLRKQDIQLLEEIVSFTTLKRRGVHHVREIPISREFALDLVIIHFAEHSTTGENLWGDGSKPPSRSACYRWVKEIMAHAGISGPQACPKGLRHGFAVHALLMGVPLHIVQRWLGHASLVTTVIYTMVVGPEERAFARRMW